MTESTKKSFFSDLWDRRVPQFTATYVGLVWGITQFLVFLSNRYDAPDYIVDKFLLFCTILLPAVVLFIYNHGKEGKDEYKSYEKFLYPAFLMTAIGALSFSGGSNQLQSAPVELKVTTDEGNTITRLVPSSGQTKSIAMFPFANKGDKNDNWLKFSLPTMFELDMEQDMRIFSLSYNSLTYDIESADYSMEDNDIPLRTFLKIARDNISDYFLTGEYIVENDNLILDVTLYETATGEVFYTEHIETQDKIGIVDDLNNKIMENLFLKDAKETETKLTDLPVAELISNNELAIKNYIEGRMLMSKGKSDEAKVKMEKAVELDDRSVLFNTYNAVLQYREGKKQESIENLENTISLSEGLPERQKFRTKQIYYQFSDQQDKLLLLSKYWKDLYPRDFVPYNDLINYYSMTLNLGDAKEISLEALDNGHGARVLNRLADICIKRQEFEEAEKYINEYYDLFPDKKIEEDQLLPMIYLKQGKFDKAEKLYESILINNPGDQKTLLSLADLYTTKGAMDKAEVTYEKALSKAKLKSDSINIIFKKLIYYVSTGETTKFKDEATMHLQLLKDNGGELSAYFGQLQLSGAYTVMGHKNIIEGFNQKVSVMVPEHAFTYDCVSGFLIAMISGDLESFEKYNQGQCRDLIANSTPHMDILADGVLAKLKKDPEGSIKLFEAYIDSTGQSNENLGSWVAEQYRILGDYDKSIVYCNENLKIKPGDANLQMQLSKTLLALGKKDEAKKVFNKVEELWKNAEPNFMYYDSLMIYKAQLESI